MSVLHQRHVCVCLTLDLRRHESCLPPSSGFSAKVMSREDTLRDVPAACGMLVNHVAIDSSADYRSALQQVHPLTHRIVDGAEQALSAGARRRAYTEILPSRITER